MPWGFGGGPWWTYSQEELERFFEYIRTYYPQFWQNYFSGISSRYFQRNFTIEQEKEILKRELKNLKRERKEIEKRLKELEKNKK